MKARVWRAAILPLCLFFASERAATQPLFGGPDRRESRVSNFEFAIHSSGLLWGFHPNVPIAGDHYRSIASWPRNSRHMIGMHGGMAFLAVKQGRYLVSDVGVLPRLPNLPAGTGFFGDFVPGRIGDEQAGYDSVFHGPGWRYVDDPDYIVYSSLDYDNTGTDITGANRNDWPLRWIDGERTYVVRPLERANYPPVFVSDEDMFCVFKDTDTRADDGYAGPDGPSVPIGIEVQLSLYSWESGPLRDIVCLEYDIQNKSGIVLDSCHFLFHPGIIISGVGGGGPAIRQVAGLDTLHGRRLAYQWATLPSEWPFRWRATPQPPTLGYPILESPSGYNGQSVGVKDSVCVHRIFFADSGGVPVYVFPSYVKRPDSVIFRAFSDPGYPPNHDLCTEFSWAVVVSDAFPMEAGQRIRFTCAIIFSDSLPHLRLLDDLIKRMHANNYQRPSAPPAPQLTAKGLNRGVKLTWDTRAEQSEDIIIPDSLGRPFVGYRLLRAAREEGPYTELARWHVDSALVHEYIDRGEDIGGLKNNVRYYYQLLSFDEGAPRIKLEPMESKPEKGVNWQSVVPGTDPADATAQGATGTLAGGTLGDVGIPELIPINTTNYNSFLSGRTIQLRINAATDGMRYTLPVTIRDTVAGREQNTILEPGLFVHGTPQTAGIKEGSVSIRDVLGLGAADITIPYRFEQLPDSLHIAQPVIHSTTGADVPIIVRDSLNVTGIQSITPRVTSGREIVVEFLAGGRDTLSILFGIILDYMNVRITDAETGDEYEPMVDWVLQPYIVRSTGGTSSPGRRNRYYLSGEVPNGQYYDAGHLLTIHQSAIAFDYPDRGQGSGKPQPLFPWGSGHRQGTQDFRAGDRVRITWDGGVKGRFPENALVELTGPPPGRRDVTDDMMENIRVVPNPYLIRHEAQRGEPRIYFNYLPDECTIRIYTIALDLVKTIQHRGGSRVEWDLTTEGGQLVASQMLIAHIEAPNGKSTTKKFSVVLGR